MQDFRDLQVWQKAHKLTLAVYSATAAFPSSERYGITSQLRRSAASIGANLAEGAGRRGDAEFAHFCSIAMGSACELDYHLLLAKDLNLLSIVHYEQLIKPTGEVKRMLTGLFQRMKPSSKFKKLKADS